MSNAPISAKNQPAKQYPHDGSIYHSISHTISPLTDLPGSLVLHTRTTSIHQIENLKEHRDRRHFPTDTLQKGEPVSMFNVAVDALRSQSMDHVFKGFNICFKVRLWSSLARKETASRLYHEFTEVTPVQKFSSGPEIDTEVETLAYRSDQLPTPVMRTPPSLP
jgi:hypothetical protein